MTTITTSENKKIYFASDQHLGAPTPKASLPREKKFVAWLDTIKEDDLYDNESSEKEINNYKVYRI